MKLYSLFLVLITLFSCNDIALKNDLAKSNELASKLLAEKILDYKDTIQKKYELAYKKRFRNYLLIDLFDCISDDLNSNNRLTYSKNDLQNYFEFRKANMKSNLLENNSIFIWKNINENALSNSENMIKLNDLIDAIYFENPVYLGCFFNGNSIELLNKNDKIYIKSNENYKYEVKFISNRKYNEFTTFPERIDSINNKSAFDYKNSFIEINTFGLSDTTIIYPIKLKTKDAFGDWKTYEKEYKFEIIE